MKTNQVKAGSILSYLQIALGIVISLLYTPVMIRLLGQNEYGLYNTASSTISILSILSLGFQSGYIRYFSQYRKENAEEKIHRLNGLFLLIFTVIGIVALICGLFLSSHLELVYKDGLTPEEMGTARILMILLTVNLAVSFPMSVFSNIISAHERFVFLKSLGLFKTVLSPLLSLPLLLAGFRSVGLVAVTLLLSCVTDLLYLYYVTRRLKCRFVLRGIPRELFTSLLVYTTFIAINIIVDQINWNIDKVLLGRFKGTAAVAVYSVGYTIYTYFMMLSTSVSGLFTPRIHRIVTTTAEEKAKQRQALTELFIKVGRIQFLTLALFACGFIFFGRVFIALWAGAGYDDSYAVVLLLILPAYPALIQNIGIEVQRAQNLHKFRSLAYSIMAVLNLLLSINLCRKYGAVGSALGTAVSLIVCNGFIMNLYYHKKCNLDILAFWKSILRACPGVIAAAVVGVLTEVLWPSGQILPFLIKIAGFTVVYAVFVWCFSMNPYEKNQCRRLVRTVLRRKRGQ